LIERSRIQADRCKRRPAALENEKAVFHFRTGDGDWMFAWKIMAAV
jgi:hypothetical protein